MTIKCSICPPTIYTVTANLDQLKNKLPEYSSIFIKDKTDLHGIPVKGLVQAEFTDLEKAAEVYYNVRKANIASTRNWIG